MDITTLDYVLLAAIGVLAIIGLFKGFSGWMGTVVGVAVAAVAGYFAFGYCMLAASSCPWVSGPFVRLAAAILDLFLTLLVFGLVRRLAVRFFSFLLPQPLDALTGMTGGFFLGLVLTVLLAGTAFFEGCPLTEGFLASHSRIVRMAASVLEARLEATSK